MALATTQSLDMYAKQVADYFGDKCLTMREAHLVHWVTRRFGTLSAEQVAYVVDNAKRLVRGE